MITPSRNHPVPVFVYGTLRKGGTLREYYLTDEATHGATVRGFRLRAFDGNAGYPWMVEQAGGMVKGEIVWVTDPQVLARMRTMEENAGYVTQWVTATSDDHVVDVDALAFVYPHQIGTIDVPGGDWITYQEQQSGQVALW